ncbi:MAG: peptide deformylase [Alphaproteobacteria bacterium]
MAIQSILRMGHPILRRRADPVSNPKAIEISTLIQDLHDSMAAAGGIGLAAPQIGVPLRVILYSVPGHRLTASNSVPQQDSAALGVSLGVPPTILINPELTPLTEIKLEGWEACLSVPGLMGRVPRYESLRFQALNTDGQPIDGEAHGFHARVLQHECDHLDGILYPQQMTDLRWLMFAEEAQKLNSPEVTEALKD